MGYNYKYKRYGSIETWIGDESNQEYHNAIIYSGKHNIHVMYIHMVNNLKWHPYHYFITYDFEIFENVINNHIST